MNTGFIQRPDLIGEVMNAIEAKNLYKIYRIYQSPVHRLKEIVLRRPFHSEFVALEDINFTVQKGESYGVIGENGAGKSTLLKILSRTLKHTSGKLSINGRTAALLELGAGFNPELTGEENIYLNAYLMGLTKKEIDDRKDSIIDFSELGDFIKRPVKTYSSGMHVRLAFSIATSVDPEILIIDEALSVGDERFQKKCIDRMIHFRQSGKTIFFCSHSMYLVQELCDKSIWLKNGKMANAGRTSDVINSYTDWMREKDTGLSISTKEAETDKSENKRLWIESAIAADRRGREIEMTKIGEDIFLRMVVRTLEKKDIIRGHVAVGIKRNDDETVYGVTTKMDGFLPVAFFDGQVIMLKFPSVPLLSGQYFMLVYLGDEHALHPYDTCRTNMFSVVNLLADTGMVRLNHEWIMDRHLPEHCEHDADFPRD